MTMKNIFLTILSLMFIVSSCDLYPQDEYEEFYVVESYLVANRQLPLLKLSTTAPATEVYNFDNLGVNNATVQVFLLEGAEGTNPEQVFSYTNTAPGIYEATVQHDVLPTRTYQLNITFPDPVEEVNAFTIVPDTFSVIGGVPSSIVYQSTEQLEVTLSESSYPGRQNVYIFNTIAGEPIVENLTPLYADFYEDEDDLEDFANLSSGILNEANFDENPDGTVTVRYPWLAVAYFGDSRIVANTIDDNIYDFVRSQSVQLGGSTLSPGEIQNVIYRMEGAIGVFGAIASDTIQTDIQRPSF